jgi:6-phosphogluconolactonase (cycloisomerase 2 family)
MTLTSTIARSGLAPRSKTALTFCAAVAASIFSLVLASPETSRGEARFLYIQSNSIAEGQNSILAYERLSDGKLEPLPGSPFLTGGTGVNNDTHAKIGPHDNDTPIVLDDDGRRLFAVNAHSNTIAVFDIQPDGSLRHVQGSPFPSMGIGPNSLSLSGDVLVVANRNGDYHQLQAFRGGALGNYASFRVNADGSLSFLSKIELNGGEKPIQVLTSSRNRRVVFGVTFQVDVDFDGDGARSVLIGNEPRVAGSLHAFELDARGHLTKTADFTLPETAEGYLYMGYPDVPSLPLGIWDHPQKNLLYVGFVTRNELGVVRYSDDGKLTFVTAVPNSGQDICWVRVNQAGTRLYTANNIPRADLHDKASTISIYDISGDKAEKPVEIGRVELPLSGGTFVNNRMFEQPDSTPFQMDLDPTESFLYVLNQRVNQTPENTTKEGNVLHVLEIAPSGLLEVVGSRRLEQDGVDYRSRPQGIVTLDMS